MKTHVTQFIPRSAESKKRLLVSLIMLGFLLPGISLTLNASLFTPRPELSTPLTPTLTVNTVDMTGAPLTG